MNLQFEEGKRYTVRDDFNAPLNTAHDEIYANIRKNIRRPLPQVYPFPPNDYKAMLLCGGPTLYEHMPEIKRKRKQGWKIITVNQVHDRIQDFGLEPSMQVMLDARPSNARFVSQPVKDCRYLLCNQVHPDVFDALEGYDVRIWHAHASSKTEKSMLDKYYMKRWAPIQGGTSVGPRAMMLAFYLGIRNIEIYGLDGCLLDGKHHSFDQPENDFDFITTVQISRKRFLVHGWMVKQLDEIMQLLPIIPDEFNVSFMGRGMIAYLVERFGSQRSLPKVEVVKTERIK